MAASNAKNRKGGAGKGDSAKAGGGGDLLDAAINSVSPDQVLESLYQNNRPVYKDVERITMGGSLSGLKSPEAKRLRAEGMKRDQIYQALLSGEVMRQANNNANASQNTTVPFKRK